jgi:hypothetical protein
MKRIPDKKIRELWRSWEIIDCPDKETAEEIAVERLTSLLNIQLDQCKADQKEERRAIGEAMAKELGIGTSGVRVLGKFMRALKQGKLPKGMVK